MSNEQQAPQTPPSFSLTLEEQRVTVGGDDYVVTELTGKQRDRYLTGISARMKPAAGAGKGAPQQLQDFDGLQASLVAIALRKIEQDGGRTAVAVETIQKWPSKVVSGLYDIAAKLSALGDQEGGEKGND